MSVGKSFPKYQETCAAILKDERRWCLKRSALIILAVLVVDLPVVFFWGWLPVLLPTTVGLVFMVLYWSRYVTTRSRMRCAYYGSSHGELRRLTHLTV
jgi:hypothetical protein